MSASAEFFGRCHAALAASSPQRKCELVDALHNDVINGHLELTSLANCDVIEVEEPGRPQQPELVSPRSLPRRGLGSREGQAALIHAVAHIEFNAINLALDAICRYPEMPTDYYRDWLQVAREESKHFNLLSHRLQQLNYAYGDFSAHNGLWDIAMRTAHDPVHRMAMVPRMMEARGLDVTPGMIKRFRKIGDAETAAILEVILREEIGHVEAGSRWFAWLCQQQDIDSEQTWLELIQTYLASDIRCPLNWETRRQAGFTDYELEHLQELCSRN